jgi:hypothetical protein
MLRYLCSFLLLLTVAGCGVKQSERIPGVWSNGELGRIVDVTPSGFYAEVWLDSQAQVSTWQISKDDTLTLMPLCTSLPEGKRSVDFSFDDDALSFPAKGGRYSRYAKEARQVPADARLVGLWQRESETRKKEFLEFTPWGTAVWNRWDGKPGSEKLVAGWASPIPAKDGGLLFTGVEDGELLNWNQPVDYEVSTTKLSLVLPAGIGKKDYVKANGSDLLKAASAPTR